MRRIPPKKFFPETFALISLFLRNFISTFDQWRPKFFVPPKFYLYTQSCISFLTRWEDSALPQKNTMKLTNWATSRYCRFVLESANWFHWKSKFFPLQIDEKSPAKIDSEGKPSDGAAAGKKLKNSFHSRKFQFSFFIQQQRRRKLP